MRVLFIVILVIVCACLSGATVDDSQGEVCEWFGPQSGGADHDGYTGHSAVLKSSPCFSMNTASYVLFSAPEGVCTIDVRIIGVWTACEGAGTDCDVYVGSGQIVAFSAGVGVVFAQAMLPSGGPGTSFDP